MIDDESEVLEIQRSSWSMKKTNYTDCNKELDLY